MVDEGNHSAGSTNEPFGPISVIVWKKCPDLKMSQQNLGTTVKPSWVTTSKAVRFLFTVFPFLRWTITFDSPLPLLQSLQSKNQSDGVQLGSELCCSPFASVESAHEKRILMVAVFQDREGCSCEFKRVGDGSLPEQSESWLRNSNLCALNHTALLSARGYNQGNTSKSGLQSSSASRAGL